MVNTFNNQYAFTHTFGDRIRGGQKADIEGTIVYTGETFSSHYVSASNLSEVPDAVLDEVRDRGFEILAGTDGGWDSWDGRPEFSTSYVDISEAEKV